MKPIGAIPTEYCNITFRSRLEARWAVFFETLGIPWLYEEETFNLGDRLYTPDFYLPRQKAWIEIKPNLEENMSHLFTFSEIVRDAGQRVHSFHGSIPKDANRNNECGPDWACVYEGVFDESGKMVTASDCPHVFCHCPYCGEYGIEFSGDSVRIKCCSENAVRNRVNHRDWDAMQPNIAMAYAAARNAKWDHESKRWQ